MNIILLGPPGSGKGTQGAIIEKTFGIKRIVAGDLVRAAAKQDNEVGKKIKSITESGKLLPDDLIIDLISERIKELETNSEGFILDGFPRTIEQAKYLDQALNNLGQSVDIVFALDVKDEELIKRLSGRYSCGKCQADYNKFYKLPKIDGICDECGSKEFTSRADDREQTVRDRLNIYHDQTAKLLPFYEDKDLLVKINGIDDVNHVTRIINSELQLQAKEELN